MNFYSRSFVGGYEACDFQAWYAAYYTFSSMASAAYGFVMTCYLIASAAPRWIIVAVVGALIHLVSIIIASLPLVGVGSYLFAIDYCTHDVEGNFFATTYLIWYVGCITAIIVAIVRTRSWTKENKSNGVQGLHPSVYLVRLLAAFACYFVVAWSVSIIIVMCGLAEGNVYSSRLQRLYAAQAIIMHSNQLFVPLMFGGLWRHKILTSLQA